LGGINIILLSLVAIVFVIWRLTKGRLGNAWAAIRQDELAALSQGIHVARYKMIAFVISALMAGYAGALEAHLTFNIDPGDAQYGVTRAVQILTFAVLGGSGFVLGPVVGALIITLLPYVFGAAGPYINIVSGAFLIAVIIFRPQGIVGRGGLAIVRPSWWPRARVSAPSTG
jgi:branched-chain amino acid transport system permease protein